MKADGAAAGGSYAAPLLPRLLLGLAGVVCAAAAARYAWEAVSRPSGGAAAIALAAAIPCVAAWSALRERWSIDAEGLRVRGLRRERLYPWSTVRRADALAGSFVVDSQAGPLRPVWLTAGTRDALLAEIVERAGLARTLADAPFGVRARYVRRASGARLSHAQRREREAESEKEGRA